MLRPRLVPLPHLNPLAQVFVYHGLLIEGRVTLYVLANVYRFLEAFFAPAFFRG